MSLNAETKISAAIVKLTDFQRGWAPYLSVELHGLIRQESREIKTLAVTAGRVLLWSRAYVDSVTVEVLALGLYHELLHIALKVHARTEALLGIKIDGSTRYSPEIAEKLLNSNKAHDAVVNEILRQTYQTPADWIYPETLGQAPGLSFEERFWLLENKAQAKKAEQAEQAEKAEKGEKNEDSDENKGDESSEGEDSSEGSEGDDGEESSEGDGEGDGEGGEGEGNGEGSGEGGEGEGNGEGSGEGEGQGEASGEGGHGQGHGHGRGDVGRGHCGSCAGNPVDGEPDNGVSPAEGDRRQRAVAEAIAKQIAQKGRGSVPSALAVWAEEILKPAKVDWRTQLAREVRRAVSHVAGATDLTWRRPSRRQAGIGFGMGRPVAPALHAPVPNVSVILDTSGSMGQEELSAGVNELTGILKTLNTRVSFVTCDAAVQGIVKITTPKEAIKALHGGGGTDLRPAFEALSKLRERPEIVIVITDGQVGYGVPETAPAWAQVIWVLVGRYRQKPCDWGRMIEIDDLGAAKKVA